MSASRRVVTRVALALLVALVASRSVAASTPRTRTGTTGHHAPAAVGAPRRDTVTVAEPGGRWRLDVAHSVFGPAAASPPRERVDQWERRGAGYHVHSVTIQANGDSLKLDWDCRLDSVVVVNTMMGTPVQTIGTRHGRVVHLVFSATGGFGSIVTDERWTMAADRTAWVLERETRGPMGNYRQRYVFRPA